MLRAKGLHFGPRQTRAKRPPSRAPTGRKRLPRGFTLVELLVALALMALMAGLSWRGFNAMNLSRQQLSGYSDQVLSLQNGMAQWTADLEALEKQPGFNSLDWDGRALRILRRSSQAPGDGLYVVAWAQGIRAQGSVWLRWQSAPLTSRAQLFAAWNQAALWAQNPSDAERQREVIIAPLSGWQVVFFRGGAWSNALSSADVTTTAAPATSTPQPESPVAPLPAETASDATKAASVTSETSPPAAAAAPSSGAVPLGSETMPDGIRLVLTLPKGSVISGQLIRDWSMPGLGAL